MRNAVLEFGEVENKIITIRDQKVIVDSDVATLYGVETKRINEAVKNNPDKFPGGYMMELSQSEWDGLKSKFSTSIKGGKVKLPTAFAEKGLYMLATILKSSRATETTFVMNCYLSRNYKGTDGAGNRAKTDVEQIMKNLHFKNVGLKQTQYQNSLLACLFTLMGVLKCGFYFSKAIQSAIINLSVN